MNARIGITVLVLVVVAGVGYMLFPKEAASPTAPLPQQNDPTSAEEYQLTHTFEDGVHTIAGVLTLPTPCHEIQTDVTVAESFPEQVSITVTTQATDGICIQVIDEREFSVEVEVDQNATFSLTINGEQVVVPNLADV